VFCRSLFVLLSVFFWPLYCLVHLLLAIVLSCPSSMYSFWLSLFVSSNLCYVWNFITKHTNYVRLFFFPHCSWVLLNLGSPLPPVVCRRDHVVFTLFVFFYVWWCPTHIMFCFCFVCHRRVYPRLPVSLFILFCIAHSVFYSMYIFRFFYILFMFSIQKLFHRTYFILWFSINSYITHCAAIRDMCFLNCDIYLNVVIIIVELIFLIMSMYVCVIWK
jgi:hypothetical protein